MTGVDPTDKLVELKSEEVDFLAAVAKRAFQSVLRHPEPIDLTTGEGSRRDVPREDLFIASLAFQLPDPSAHSRELPRPSAQGRPWSPEHRYSLVEFRGKGESFVREELFQITEDFLQFTTTVGAPPHFVLLNELSHAFEKQDRLKSRWAELAKTHSTYIVPGTFHCNGEFFGVAPIYCPNPERNHYALKQNAAIKQRERIRTPDARELFVFETDYGNIVLWICLDMYDPGLVLKFLNITHRFTGKPEERAKVKREISLVLIPAYSTDSADNIRNCVRTISRFSKTAMVCTNSYLGSRLESHGFSCGEPLTVVLEKEYPLPGLSGPFCKAILYKINLKDLQQNQASNYEQNGIFSSTFSAIINGGPYVLRDIPD
jgi:hypothetical protein